ncbi:uncharacterized protein LOC132199082 [Neocloeon triangulifer]|uniref:uncharacterized protein LOC132199082 n=1 Tax=Neocloeon triangulifer TaxID=2078957 RepID=UPI00286F2272|nr:uncharacterized protein LOC132199082 [Neocloeon triangulifer]
MASLPEQLIAVLRQVLGKEGKILEKHSIAAGCKPGDNFMGEITKVTAHSRDGNGAHVEDKFVFKCPPADKAYREGLQSHKFVKNEEAFYSQVVPAMDEFLKLASGNKIASVPVPIYFCSTSDGDSDVLVLEDLSLSGFTLGDKVEGFNLEECHFVLKKLGLFHAISLAMQELKPEEFFKVRNYIKEVFFFEEGRPQFSTIHFPCNAGVRMLQDRYPKKPEYVQKLRAVSDEFFTNLVEMVKTPTPLAVINHGDCWVNNTMIKYEQGKPVDLRFLDFQIARFSSLALDLSYLLYCSCQKSLLDQHYDEFIKTYVDAVNEAILSMGAKKSIITKYQVDQEMKRFASFGVLHALMAVPFFVTPVEDQPKLEGGIEVFDKFHQTTYKNVLIRDRVTDMIVHAIERGFL